MAMKMKKILLMLAVLFGCAFMGYAQTKLVATLQHESQFSQYYGSGALTTAYNNAVDGDIITLSPGTFTFSGSIEKGVTLRGTGIETAHESLNSAKPYLTMISGNVRFFSNNSESVTVVEGVRFESYVYIDNKPSDNGQGTIKFIKNSFSSVYFESSFSEIPEIRPTVRFYNSIISGNVSFRQYTNPDYKFFNCYVPVPSSSAGENPSAFYNCILTYRGVDRYSTSLLPNTAYLNFYNCIFCNLNTASTDNFSGSLNSKASCSNCLSIGTNTNIFNGIFYNNNNQTISDISDVFKTYTRSGVWHETFELTDAAKTEYLGTDGTEIGMQGGLYPYNVKVQYPVITSFTSDAQTTKDGKLNVSIEVDGN